MESGARLRKANDLARKAQRVRRGAKLADFGLFEQIANVRRLRPKARVTGNEQADAEMHLDRAFLPQVEAALGKRLVDALIRGDAATLEKAIETEDWLRHDRKNRLDWLLLAYFRQHDSRKIGELLVWVGERMGWKIYDLPKRNSRWAMKQKRSDKCPTYIRQIQRRCEKLGLEIDESKPGPSRV